MCGIVGLVAFDAPLEQVRTVVSAMNARIAHRGPDGEGLVAHEDATMAMKRLAIVDVEHGQQPMLSDDESVALVYNGEIYNAPALRRELEARGVRFRTRSDTEVILRLYEQDPERVEEQLVGMWSFAIHDRRRRRVVLSRDRFGIKPLFVADTGSALAFASELRCFKRSLAGFARLFAVDHGAAHAMLSWSYVPESATIYRGVRRVTPATRLTIDLATGARTERAYWALEPSPEAARISSLDEACEAVEVVLRRAVKEHLESDVPVAAFLSGGIDSSLITGYALDAGADIKSYSIGFQESFFDESPFARETAEKLGIPCAVEMFDEEKARARLADALLAYDEPFGDSSSLATFLLSQHVARDYKVALGGDGGDEIFAGYKKYIVARLRRPFRGAPRLRDGLGDMLGRIPVRHDRTRGWTEALRTLRRLSRGLAGSDAHIYTQLTQVAPLAKTALLLREPGDALRFEHEMHARFHAARGTELQRSLATDLAGTLCNDMLVKVDRASMACHLEARVPFLDHRVVELGVGLPPAYTLGEAMQPWSGKRVLRALHERRFGRALANRKKHGFGVPVEKWLRGPFDAACERLFDGKRLERDGILSTDSLSNGKHRMWAEKDPVLLWHAFALAAWSEVNLGDGPDALRSILGQDATPATASPSEAHRSGSSTSRRAPSNEPGGRGPLIVLDYGVNNVGSVVNMLRRLGVRAEVGTHPRDVQRASALVMPGIGAFDSGVAQLRRTGLFDALRARLASDEIPLLGICLGMQLLTRGSEEGKLEGLGLVPAVTKRLSPEDRRLKVPHMGWNTTECLDSDLFAGLMGEAARFYYVHSFHVVCDEQSSVAARCTYGGAVTSAIRQGTIFGTQFHPEKSHRFGMRVLENFARISGHA